MKLFVVFAVAVALVNAIPFDTVPKPAFPSARIINGSPAKPGEAPYIVSLNLLGHFCAGSVIHKNWVLTAGHCLVYNSFKVVAGLHSRNNESDVQIRKVKKRSQLIVHKKYHGGVGPYDIGLIYIPEAFDLNALTRAGVSPVGTVDLPSGQYEETGPGKLFGWGRDNLNQLPNELQYLDASIIDYDDCKAALPATDPIDPTNICTHTPQTADGACHGDSGGPLVRYNPDGVELVGIVSWGYTPCTSRDTPSVYTKVSSFKEWINENMKKFR